MATTKKTDTADKKVTTKEEVKKTPVATATVKKETTPAKAPAAKEETKKAPAKAEASKKEAPKAAAKTQAKKPAKSFSKKNIVYKTIAVEHGENQIDLESIKKKAIDAWQKAGNKVRDIKTIDLYIKPEDGKFYPVVNGDDLGGNGFDLF